MHPDRIILGVEDTQTAERLQKLYSDTLCPIIETDLRTAEAIKCITNAFLATKVSLANEMANLCDAFDVSYDEMISGVALDPRISPEFLVPGVGFGGSCLSKDIRALAAAGDAKGSDLRLLKSVHAQNENQYMRAVELLRAQIGELKAKRIALLGLAFKGGTDDVRESRALNIARHLIKEGATVVAFDPVANENFHRLVPEAAIAHSVEEVLRGADACILQADWDEFSQLQAEDFQREMQEPVVLDGRRILDPEKMGGVTLLRIG